MRTWVLLIISVLALTFLGCNQDEECAQAYVDYIIIPADSLCFGNWEWAYTLKHERTAPSAPSYVTDTIFPGDSEPGFGIIHYAYGTVGKSEIHFNINGTVSTGCYKYWTSRLYPAVEPTYVSTTFFEWNALGYGALGVDANLPLEEGNPIIAKIGSLKMFKTGGVQADTLFYRNWFVKVD